MNYFLLKYFSAPILLLGVITSELYAVEPPKIHVKSLSAILSGKVSDGYRFAAVSIMSMERHSGFRVWSDLPRPGSAPNKYEAKGRNHSNQKLRFRIEGSGWVSNTDENNGIILPSNEHMSLFYLVVDGDQYILPDRYQIDIGGSILIK